MRVTACIATYKGRNEAWFKETVESIRSQGIEPVIMDDERPAGHKWDEAIATCKTEYLALPHHDDVYLPGFFDQTVEYLDSHPECAAVFTLDYIIDGNGKRKGMTQLPFPPRDTYDFEFVFMAMLQHGNFIRCPSVVYRVDKVRGLRYLTEECRTAGDTAMWFQVMDKAGPIGIIPKPLYMYRQHDTSDTQKNVVGGGLQRFDHIDALDYAASLRPQEVPWVWPFMREKNYADREVVREEIKVRELLGSTSGTRFVVCHEAPENAGTGILVSERCRRLVSGDNDEAPVYVFPVGEAFKVLERSELPSHRGYPVLPLHPQRFRDAINKYKPTHVEWHHLLRWPEENIQFATSVYLHDSYLWCGTWHQLNSRSEPCPGPTRERCEECIGKEKYEEVQERKKKFLDNLKPGVPVYANSKWLQAIAASELDREIVLHEWEVPPIKRHDFKAKVGYFGTFTSVKGTDVLLAAATRMPDVQFLLWCEPPKQFDWMMDGRVVHGFPNILFLGPYHRHNLGSLVGLVDVVVVPSRCESWGLVRREVESLGKKVVATDTGGLGGTVKPGDVPALVDAIRRAL